MPRGWAWEVTPHCSAPGTAFLQTRLPMGRVPLRLWGSAVCSAVSGLPGGGDSEDPGTAFRDGWLALVLAQAAQTN